MSVRIVDLASDPAFVDGAAALLHDAFRGRSSDWQDLDSARAEVCESLEERRVSRVAIDGGVIGWIGAIPLYGGKVWEVHPLVVASSHRRRGVGRSLIEDIEKTAAERGALTLFTGSDDENDETSLSSADLYRDVATAIRDVRNFKQHSYEFYLRVGFKIVGVLPDANGVGKPDIFLAKRVARRR